MSELQSLMEPVIALVRQAGDAIMAVYADDFDVEHKADRSPLTAADQAAHDILDAGLLALPGGYPVLSEESASIPWDTRRSWSTYWLVDPLDGTREFVKRNGEFTVNVALIRGDRPVLGVVFAPALGYLAYAAEGLGAFRRAANGQDIGLRTRPETQGPLRVAASRSHLDARTLALLERVGPHERIGLGSSLKFCRIAEGQIDLYPRFGPTSEWDTAAAQCVLEQAGGAVIDVHGRALRYNTKDSLLNTDFLALASAELPWRSWV